MTSIAITSLRRPSSVVWSTLAPGAAIWSLYLLVAQPSLMNIAWSRAILLLAALVVMPLALPLLRDEKRLAPLLQLAERSRFLAAVLLAFSLAQVEGASAVLLAVPWLVVTLLIATQGMLDLAGRQRAAIVALAMCYLAIGGVWAVCDRAGWAPLGFDREIGLLTSIHFHFAGFALPLLAALAAGELGTPAARRTAWAATITPPLLAVGITSAHFGAPAAIETVAAAVMACAAIAVAWQYGRLSAQPGAEFSVRFCWTIAALMLAAAMIPAIAYGARSFRPIPWLDIPLMRIVHGSANAFGFTLPALLGWRWRRRS